MTLHRYPGQAPARARERRRQRRKLAKRRRVNAAGHRGPSAVGQRGPSVAGQRALSAAGQRGPNVASQRSPSVAGRTKCRKTARGAKVNKKHCAHRLCIRCGRRRDECGTRFPCKPYSFKPRVRQLQSFAKFLTEQQHALDGVRFVSDFMDVSCVVSWARRMAASCGFKVALFGLCVFSHFNSLRTFGVLQSSIGSPMRWDVFRRGLKKCKRNWGGKKKHGALLSKQHCRVWVPPGSWWGLYGCVRPRLQEASVLRTFVRSGFVHRAWRGLLRGL